MKFDRVARKIIFLKINIYKIHGLTVPIELKLSIVIANIFLCATVKFQLLAMSSSGENDILNQSDHLIIVCKLMQMNERDFGDGT